ncbi:hypothetical protein BDV3_004569 [Batrachochytrium dendrobatidis]
MWVAGQQINGEYQNIAVHSSLPLQAISLHDSQIQIHDEEGTHLESLALKKDSVPTKMVWHPTKKQLAMAWNGGTVGLWCVDMESTLREGKIHQCRITCLEWNSFGNRIISGDEEGAVVVWKVDTRGRLSTMSQYRLKSQIVCCVFRTSSGLCLERHREKDSPPFFIASQSGSIYYADDIGHCTEVSSLKSPIVSLYISGTHNSMFVLSDDLILSRFDLDQDGKMTQNTSMKLSNGLKALGINLISAWIEPGMLAMTVNGSPVRIWNVWNEETCSLDRPEFGLPVYRSFQFNTRHQIMAVGSDNGIVVLWQASASTNVSENSHTWEPIHKFDLGSGSIVSLSWGKYGSILAVQKALGFQMIRQQILKSAISGTEVVAMQSDINSVEIVRHNDTPLQISIQASIKDIKVAKGVLAVLTGKGIELHLLEDQMQKGTSFPMITSASGVFAVNSNFLFVAENNHLNIYTLQGLLKNTVVIPVEEGDITHLLATDQSVILLTRGCTLNIYDIGQRDTRLMISRLLQSVLPNDTIGLFSVNSTKSMVALNVIGHPLKLIIYCIDKSQLLEYTFQGSKITDMFWDTDDQRVLVCELDKGTGDKPQISSLFVSTDFGIVVKDTSSFPDKCERLIGVSIPYLIYQQKHDLKTERLSNILFSSCQEYIGVEKEVPSVIRAITDFSYNLSNGRVDEAVKSIKLIRNQSVWENMAKICCKLRRPALAKLCLGKLKNAKALRTLNSRYLKSSDASVDQDFLTAIHLGLYDEASKICIQTNRFDLQSELQQCMGQWEKAIESAATKDRPLLPAVFYNFGKYLEEIGDLSGAVAAYEKSNTARAQIPKILLAQPTELQNYIDGSSDLSLKLWWAQNAESHGDFTTATKYYKDANDLLSLARVCCLSGDTEAAVKLESEHPESAAVAYYLGRQFEEEGKIDTAISYYSKAGSFSSAIRLSKEHKLEKNLVHLALQSSPELINEVAQYFINTGQPQKAIPLYSKIGNVSKALEICYATKDMQMLSTIAMTLDPVNDVNALTQIAQFLMDNEAIQNAMQLFLLIQNHDAILNLCQKNQIILSEEIIEKMKIDNTASIKKEIYTKMADICFSQGSYYLACKQYTLAGDRLRAMGSLLKSGDKEKIIFFANVSGSKHPEIYVITANYLQSLNWRADSSVMKAIIQFYTKAKAHSSLARFYDSCSLVEIDEFQNYEKALGALTEAEKCLMKNDAMGKSDQEMLETTQRRIHYIQIFLEAQQCAKNQNLDDMEHLCVSMLNEPDIDASVRCGDIYGLMIESNYSNGNFDKARKQLGELNLRLTNTSADYYVDKVIVHALGGALEQASAYNQNDTVEDDF